MSKATTLLAVTYTSCADPHGPVLDAAAFWRDHSDTDPVALATFAHTWACVVRLRNRLRLLLEDTAAWLAAVHSDWCVATRVYSGLRLVVLQCAPDLVDHARARLRLSGIVHQGLLWYDSDGHCLRNPVYVRVTGQAPTRPPPPPTTRPPIHSVNMRVLVSRFTTLGSPRLATFVRA